MQDIGVALWREIRNAKETKDPREMKKLSCWFGPDAWWKKKIFGWSQPCKKHCIRACLKTIINGFGYLAPMRTQERKWREHVFPISDAVNMPWLQAVRKYTNAGRFRRLTFWRQNSNDSKIPVNFWLSECRKGISASQSLSFPCRQNYRSQVYVAILKLQIFRNCIFMY